MRVFSGKKYYYILGKVLCRKLYMIVLSTVFLLLLLFLLGKQLLCLPRREGLMFRDHFIDFYDVKNMRRQITIKYQKQFLFKKQPAFIRAIITLCV